jgi:hypothetical protein
MERLARADTLACAGTPTSINLPNPSNAPSAVEIRVAGLEFQLDAGIAANALLGGLVAVRLRQLGEGLPTSRRLVVGLGPGFPASPQRRTLATPPLAGNAAFFNPLGKIVFLAEIGLGCLAHASLLYYLIKRVIILVLNQPRAIRSPRPLAAAPHGVCRDLAHRPVILM